MKFRVALGTVCFLSILAGCGGAQQAPAASPEPVHGGAATPAADVKRPGEAKIGDRTSCPISHEEFVVTADSPKAEYEGKTYYFCCGNCAKRFQADPKKFITST